MPLGHVAKHCLVATNACFLLVTGAIPLVLAQDAPGPAPKNAPTTKDLPASKDIPSPQDTPASSNATTLPAPVQLPPTPVQMAPDPLQVDQSLDAAHPFTGRISLDINKIRQQETLPANVSPILIDALKERNLTLEQTLQLASRRNLAYLQQKWLGRSTDLQFLGAIGAMNPYFVGQNVQNFRIATNPNPQQGQILIQGQPLNRLRYGSWGFNLGNQGTQFFGLFNTFYASRVQAAAVKTSLQDTLFTATNNYFSLCKEISMLHVADIVVENSKGIVSLNQALWDSGMGTRLQLLQAQTQLAQDRQNLVSQQVQARVAAINLGVTLNLPLIDYILPQATPLDKTTLVDPHLPVDTLVSIALRTRPEILQQRNQVRQQLAQAAQTLSPLLPTASYQVWQGTFFPTDGTGATSGIQRSLQFTWQLNNLGIAAGTNLAAGLASARAAEYALRNTELQVRQQVRQSYDSSLAAEKNIEIAKEAAAEAQEQLKLAEERLQAGIGINIDVIQAQTALTGALQNYVRAIYDYNNQQAQLRRAVGGFTLKAVRAKLRYN